MMNLFRRLLHEASLSKAGFILSISLGLSAGILGILQARAVSRLISQVFLQAKDLKSVSGILFFLLSVVTLRAAFNWGQELSAGAAARRIKNTLRQRLYSHLITLGPAYLKPGDRDQKVETGELVNTLTEGMEALEVYYSQYLPQVALSALIPISILIFVFPSDLLSGAVLLVTAPLLPLFMVLIGNAAKNATRKQWRGLSRMSAYFLDVIQGLATLKALGRSREQVKIIQKVSEQYRKTTLEVLKVTFLSALVLELVATLSTAVVAVEVGLRLLYGRMAFEQAFFVLLLAPEFYLPLRLLGTRFHAAMTGVEAARRMYGILDIPGSLQGNNSNLISDNRLEKRIPPSICFNHVKFSYSNQQLALDDVCLEIPAGKITALQGESGAGKTTLTWLLLRFLQPQSGGILVDGQALIGIPPTDWWDQLAWVPQNPYLFNDTVAANIKLARPAATQEEVERAARQAHAEEFINHLPRGYTTQLGERGARLSAGQAQRIAIARAFLKNAPLLLLDEATSHLDPETDALLQDSLAKLSRGRTVWVIAHHRSTLSAAEHVIRLHHGRVEQAEDFPVRSATNKLSQGTSASSIPLPLPPVDLAEEQASFPAQSQTAQGKLEENLESLHATSRRSTAGRLIDLLQPYAGRVALSILLGFATILSSVGLMATAAYIISAAALHPSIAELQVAIVGVRFFGLARGVFRYLERLSSHDMTLRLLACWRVWFYQALEPLAPTRLLKRHSGDLLSRIINDTSALESFYVRAFTPPFVALLVGIAMTVFLGIFTPALGFTLAGFLLLAGLVLPVWSLFQSHQLGTQISERRARLNTVLVDGIQGLPDLLTHGQAEMQVERVNQAGLHLSELQKRLAHSIALQNALGGLTASLCMLTVLALAIPMVVEGQLSGVLLGVVALAALMSFEGMQPLPQAAQNFEVSRTAAQRLYELVDAEPAVKDPTSPTVIPRGTHLEVRDLSFQYPAWASETVPAGEPEFGLDKITFSLPEGKHIAMVGPSGAGKTSLLSLLQRFWEYSQGSILLDGSELRSYPQDAIRSRMAVVSHDPYIFSATLRENLLITRPDASQEDLDQAVQAAQLHELVNSMPEGYNTWIGEHGLRLSAGERQRLALARLFLRKSPLMVLDEPTANLDPATERAVLNSLFHFSQGRSLISITQHMVGLEQMDEILVFRQGRIVERGSHAELIARHGYYARMWELYHQVI